MRVYFKFVVLILFGLSFACSGESKPSTPLETLQAYTRAIKRKDTTEMKLLLSDASLKMAEQEAKAQSRPLDDIVKNETLFNESQSELKYRNEKIEGERGSIEVKNSFGMWNTVPFVREEGTWKIDKQAAADDIIKQVEEENKRFDEKNNQDRLP